MSSFGRLYRLDTAQSTWRSNPSHPKTAEHLHLHPLWEANTGDGFRVIQEVSFLVPPPTVLIRRWKARCPPTGVCIPHAPSMEPGHHWQWGRRGRLDMNPNCRHCHLLPWLDMLQNPPPSPPGLGVLSEARLRNWEFHSSPSFWEWAVVAHPAQGCAMHTSLVADGAAGRAEGL